MSLKRIFHAKNLFKWCYSNRQIQVWTNRKNLTVDCGRKKLLKINLNREPATVCLHYFGAAPRCSDIQTTLSAERCVCVSLAAGRRCVASDSRTSRLLWLSNSQWRCESLWSLLWRSGTDGEGHTLSNSIFIVGLHWDKAFLCLYERTRWNEHCIVMQLKSIDAIFSKIVRLSIQYRWLMSILHHGNLPFCVIMISWWHVNYKRKTMIQGTSFWARILIRLPNFSSDGD